MRQVTEADFRLPELRDAKLEDYEFRADGVLARKDRWKVGMVNIAGILGLQGAYEIADVVNTVRTLRMRSEAIAALLEVPPADIVGEVKLLHGNCDTAMTKLEELTERMLGQAEAELKAIKSTWPSAE